MTIEPEVQIRRCAVCRINLKGRFVYVDDGVEKLTGFTREELFGKSFLDFVDEPDRPVVLQMLQQRNHFEANFDITRLQMVNRAQQHIPANLVVSLNFIAGNPVNYQIIIDTDTNASTPQRVPAHRPDHDQFLDRLLATDSLSYAADALDALYSYFGDEHCLIYQVSSDKVDPIFWKSAAPKKGIRKSPEPKSLLQWVAISGEEYCYLDPDCARRAVERGGTAPTELISRLQLCGESYLVRILLEDATDRSEVRAVIAAVKRAIQLTERIAPQGAYTPAAERTSGSLLDDLRASLAAALRLTNLLGETRSNVK